MLDSIEEFKQGFISSEELFEVADEIDDEQLRLKLHDIALVYQNYNAVLSEKFVDSTDRLTKLYYALQNYKYFDGKTVFIDSFNSFSGQQYKILEQIISQSASVTVTLTDSPKDNRKLSVFSNIKKVKSKIINIAKRFAVPVKDDIILAKNHYESEDLAALEEFIATGKTEFNQKCDNVAICSADSVYAESDFVARNIRRIVRETGARYSDFVVIARDTAVYEDALKTACQKNNISCFIDSRIPLSSLPPAVALIAAANVAKSFSTENILRFYKSGIGVLTAEQISELEKYTYIWGIDGDKWLNEWTMDPSGFNMHEKSVENVAKKLDYLNNLRQKAIIPLKDLKEQFGGTAQNMARALVRLLDDCDAAKHFKMFAKELNGDTVYRDAIKQSWDKIMQILNSLNTCFGDLKITKREFIDALTMSIGLETVGVIPQMVDEVIFGAADRIRPSRPKYAFIMGANQGVFPRFEQKFGLFGNEERKTLISKDINIPDKTFDMAVDEDNLLYSNICCASKGLFISYTTSFDGVTAAEPSAFVGDIKNRFKCSVYNETSLLGESQLPESYEDAFSKLCGSISTDDINTVATLTASIQGSNMAQRIDNAISCRTRSQQQLMPDTAKRLFGNKLYMSASKFDVYGRCHFQYFVKHGLKVESVKPAEFSNIQRGTLIHHVLQRAVEVYGKALSGLDKPQISDLVDKYINEYLDNIVGYRDIETPYLKYLVTTIKRILEYSVGRLALEFAQTEFEPAKCELEIGYNGDIPAIVMPIDNDSSIEINGKIDRLDTWNGYVRIIDYKSGTREFKLPDVLFGQNMQMLVYLYAVAKSKEFGGIPAGILYMITVRDKANKKDKRRMNGLLGADSELILAMEKDNNGEFVPKLDEKDPSSSFVNLQEFENIFKFIESKITAIGRSILSGDVSIDPIDGIDSGACDYCDYKNICRIGKQKHKSVPWAANQDIIDEMKRQVKDVGN